MRKLPVNGNFVQRYGVLRLRYVDFSVSRDGFKPNLVSRVEGYEAPANRIVFILLHIWVDGRLAQKRAPYYRAAYGYVLTPMHRFELYRLKEV